MPRVVFDNYAVNAPPATKSLLIQWHELYNLLAIAHDDNSVRIYNSEGQPEEGGKIARSCQATNLCWHPFEPLLIIGWTDGVVSMFLSEGKSIKETQTVHSNTISVLQWNVDGSRLVSCDTDGLVSVWAIDVRGRLTPLQQYRSEGHITHCVFRSTTFKHGARKTESSATGNAPGSAIESVDSVFFFGGREGVISIADDAGNCREVVSLGSPINALLFYQDKSALVCLTQASTLAMYSVPSDMKITQVMKVKISAATSEGSAIQATWIGTGLLATSSRENMIRVWNLTTDENYVINIGARADRVTTMHYNKRKRALLAGTEEGRVYFWQFEGGHVQIQNKSAEDWEEYAQFEVGTAIDSVNWGSGESLMSIATHDEVIILQEILLQSKARGNIAAIQTATDTVALDRLQSTPKSPTASTRNATINSRLKIKGLDIQGTQCIIWNEKLVELYEISESNATLIRTFEVPGLRSAALHSVGLFACLGSKIEVYSTQGVKKQTLTFSVEEGEPISIDVHGDHLVAATSTNHIKCWSISKREAKLLGPAKYIEVDETETITSIKCNCSGSRVSLLCKNINSDFGIEGMAPTKIYVQDFEFDKLLYYDLAPFYRYPVAHFWDEIEPKLLAVESKVLKLDETEESDSGSTLSGGKARMEIRTLFATGDYGVFVQGSLLLRKAFPSLVGLRVPSLYITASRREAPQRESARRDTAAIPCIESRAMRDFEGINFDERDGAVRNALLNFSFYLSIGNLDEAFRAVKKIKDPNIWQNMAQMCVKSKRLDVAELCLGNIQDAIAAKFLREVKEREPEPEAAIAMLAIHLGMIREAEQLYKSCKRFDLLNELYRAIGRWEQAIDTAEKHDRIHLRTTHYLLARHLEATGYITKALRNYELANTHRFEIPRMLYATNNVKELERYVETSKDKDLLKWWAQYCESTGDHSSALSYYQRAEDAVSVVRLHCYMGNVQQAANSVSESGSAAAAFHLARELEDRQQFQEALHFYTVAGVHKNAIRLAKEYGSEIDVLNLAVRASPAIMIEAALFFEERGIWDKAVLLHQKAGNLIRAIDLCFRGELYDVLQNIADNISHHTQSSDIDSPEHSTYTDPQILIRCAQFFIDHSKFDKAVAMLIKAKEYTKAINLCIEKNVRMTEALAEEFTLPKSDNSEEMTMRNQVLIKVAKLAKKQNQFHLATKKYTQAGEKLKAMKALLQSGDTERIIFFASISKQRELYVLAANYLQTLDWHSDPEITKSIINFYTKAKAHESLAGFYEACSQVEIDNFRDYEKALDALKESLKCLSKARSNDSTSAANREMRLTALKKRIPIVEKYVTARALMKTNPTEMIALCNQLIDDEADIEDAVRIGDVYALMVELFYSQGKYDQAYNLIEKMRDRNIPLSYFIEQGMAEQIYMQMGIDPSKIHDDGVPTPTVSGAHNVIAGSSTGTDFQLSSLGVSTSQQHNARRRYTAAVDDDEEEFELNEEIADDD